MTPLSSLPDASRDIILDTSAVINIARCGVGSQILRAIPNKVIAPEAVDFELKIGGSLGQPDHAQLQRFVADGVVEITDLGPAGGTAFEALTLGSTAETLDDGEAATIALALEREAYAILDERKGNRIAQARYPTVPRGTTIGVLGHSASFTALGKAGVADAVFESLIQARMNVSQSELGWVVRLIGKERAAICPSISKSSLDAVIKAEGLD